MIYTFLIYVYVFQNTNFISLLTNKIVFIYHKTLMLEFLFSFFYWCISFNLNFIVYKYILLCYDRLFLDSLSIFFWFSKFKSFYINYNNKDSIDLSSTLILLFHSFCIFIIMILLSSQLDIFIFTSFFILLDSLSDTILSKKKIKNVYN